jgi:LysR family transcriptional activator of nhaA
VRVKAFNHLLGESGITLFAVSPMASRLRRRFPASLAEAPMLLPSESTAMRRSIDQWLDQHDLRPRIAGEFDDSALLKVFGQAGAGVFPARSVVEDDVRRHFGVAVVGRLDGVRERFYAISVERRLKHPGIVAISQGAREGLFLTPP